jgi:nucleoside permease NupC
MATELLNIAMFLTVPLTLLIAMVMVPIDNSEAERRRAIRQMMQNRKKRGYTPCGGQRDGQK